MRAGAPGSRRPIAGQPPGSLGVETAGEKLRMTFRALLALASRLAKYDYNPVTMDKSPKTIPAGEFKARCLALLDEVAETGKPLLVTKRGKPVARVVPVEAPPGLLHSVKKEKDLVSPIEEKWDAAS
jgi:prevent-host-death family protein